MLIYLHWFVVIYCIYYYYTGTLHKHIPNYSELNERLADLIVHSISINSGYTSMLKDNPGSELKDQVINCQFSFYIN